jgi:hypothetical protein
MSAADRERWSARVDVEGSALELAEPPALGQADAGGVRLEVRGLDPFEELRFSMGRRALRLQAGSDGALSWRDPLALYAAAGAVDLVAERRGGERRAARVRLRPNRMGEDHQAALIDALEAADAGLAGDLGGAGALQRVQTSPAEAGLELLEHAAGVLTDALVWIRARPLGRAREELAVVPASHTPRSPRDIAWLARNPHRTARFSGRGGALAIRRERQLDLDTSENRGLLTLLKQLSELHAALVAAAAAAEEALEESALPWEEARRHLQRRGLAHRRQRLDTAEDALRWARQALPLPPELPPGPFLRTPAVETHPGYWAAYRLWELARDALPLGPGSARLPLRNTDELYELWCALALVQALSALAGPGRLRAAPAASGGWFNQLPRGELAAAELGSATLRLLYEPTYGHRGEIVKLHPGRPWRPDLVVEVRRPDTPPRLHLFDAKHRLDPGGQPPLEAARELWLKYPESIGDRHTGLPLVRSVWALYPGPPGPPWTFGPAMLTPAWDPARLRGGAIPLRPGEPEALRDLTDLLELLLGR